MPNRALSTLALVSLSLLAPGSAPTAAVVTTQVPSVTGPPLPPVPADGLRIVLLGSGLGPPVNLRQYGPSTLIEAGGTRLLFDCGRGATMRLTEAGIPLGSLTRLFLTHLHSDHVIQVPDLLLAGWVTVGGRTTPLDVWGPAGTRDMMAGLAQAFAFDIRMRRDVDEKFPADGIAVRSHDIEPGVVFDEGGLRVTAFLVDHEPVAPAFGYRVDYRGRSVVLSGDTRVSENLVRAAAGVDVLIHEAIDPVAARAVARPAALSELIIAHHTTGEQAGELFDRVKPRLAVFSHAPATAGLLAQARKHYAGPLEGAEDLLTIDVAAQVTVRRLPH